MAKDLSGTNIFAQKEALANRPTYLVRLNRDHPDAEASPIHACTLTRQYVLNGITYEDIIAQGGIGDVVSSIAPGGGIADIAEWSISLVNPDPDTERLSHMLDLFFLENQEIALEHVFRTGSETQADVLKIFIGQIQDPNNDTGTFSITSKDGSRATLKTIPQEVADPVAFPLVPLDNVHKPIPWAFGNMNVEPFNTTGVRPILSPCICLDRIDQKYTASRQCKTYGQPYVFYRSARYHGKILDYTQSGDFFTIDSSRRYSEIRPMRPTATNDVEDWRNVVDGNVATGATIANTDALHLQMRGTPKLGSIDDISILIVATGSFNYTVKKFGESDITGSGSGNTSIDLSGWDFETNWDFEQIEVEIDGTGAATISRLVLAITFFEHETGDQLGFPVFQAIEGYQDIAAQYEDGGVVEEANAVLRNPVSVILAMFRHRGTGMRMLTEKIETANIAAERDKLDGWHWDFSMAQETDREGLSEMAEQGKIRLFRTYDGKWKLSVFDKTDLPAAYFSHGWNIAVENPEAPPNEQSSSLRVFLSPLNEVYNEFVLFYGWDEALGEYTEREIASPYYTSQGTCVLSLSGNTLTDESAQFITDGIQPGYKVFVLRDQLYRVVSVVSETALEIEAATEGEVVTDDYEDEYYIGPNFDFQCFRSTLKYQTTQRKTIQSKLIQDSATAQAVIAHEVDYRSERRRMASFRTGLNAVDLELTDFVVIDHPDLSPKKRPALMGALAEDIAAEDTVVPLSGSSALLLRENDVLAIKAGESTRLYHEVVIVQAVNANDGTITVLRGQCGTAARAWLADDEIWRAITKFELVQIRHMSSERMIELVARETPRDYLAVAHYSPEDTPAWIDATPEERARYGFYGHPNGEVVWLDPESDVSRYAPEPE